MADHPPTLVADIYSKYDESFQFLQNRKKRQVQQLVLLNNLQRGDENIASTMLITLLNRIVSNLYDDKLQVKFIPSEEMDQKKVNSINLLAQNDYREMDKPKLDYDWTWDTLFFGRGYMETHRWDPARKLMMPHVINPLTFGYDPFFTEPKDWRYYWKWITKSGVEINKLIKEGKIKGISSYKDLPSGIDPYLWDYKIRREQAKDATPQANDSRSGDVIQILEMFRYNEQGEKCLYWVDKNFSKVIYEEKLKNKDAEGETYWPIVVKQAFKEPHSTVDFSIADLLEDKHRARSVLLNLAFIAAKDKANPLYKYVPENVVDLTQLFSRQVNQHIPVKQIENSIEPLNTQDPLPASLNAFMNLLSQEANDPVGTGMTLNPAKKGKQSATETAIQQQLNDLAQSLQSKVLQFGEKEFWSHWYLTYRSRTKAGDQKIATVVGVKDVTFETIDLGDIHTKYPPGVMIYSAKEAEYKEMVLRRELAQMRGDFAQTWSPDAIRTFDKHVLLPKFLQDPTLIDVLLPDTFDEIKAQEENEVIAEGKALPQVQETDNHEQHLAVHRNAKPTWSKWIHMAWHEEALGQQKKVQQMQQMQQGQEGDQQGDQQGGQQGQQGGKDAKNPQEAASPLKQETVKDTTKPIKNK